MVFRLGVVVLVALCAMSANAQFSQVIGYVSQSFNLIRSDTLEVANYASLANITKKDDSNPDAKAEDYEERLYPAAKWVCTARTLPKTSSSPTRAMFLDVFRYFSGSNKDKVSIDLTVPVSTLVKPKENDMLHYETCLVLPKAHQKDPPQPDNPAVYFDNKTDRVILTRRVSGYFVSDSAWETEATSLKKFLKTMVGDDDVDFDGYYRNGYDAPMRLFNRRNEVWYIKKGPAAEKAIQEYQATLTADVAAAEAVATVTVQETQQVEEASTETIKVTKKVEATTTEKATTAKPTTAKPTTAKATTTKATTAKPTEKPVTAEDRQ